MKVAHVVRQFPPAVGGLEQVVATLATEQVRKFGLSVTVVTLDQIFVQEGARLPEHDSYQGVSVTRIPFFGSKRYPIAPTALHWIRDADIVHVHAIDFFFDYLALTKPIHRRHLVASTHGGFFHTSFARRLKQLYFNTATRASCLAYDRIIGSSEFDALKFSEIAPNKTIAIENGVDCEKFAGAASVKHVRTLIYFGRFSNNKRLEDLYALLRSLHSASTDWRLIIAGREFDITAFDLRNLAAKYQLGDHVSVHANPTDVELRGLIGNASYYICLSEHEGFGIAALEAMSAGLIPILSDIPPFRKLVEKTGMGMLVDSADLAESAAKTLRLDEAVTSNPAAHRESARAAALPYSWDHVVARYVQEYQRVLER